MFGLISNSPLSNVLAPPVSPLDEFIFHCNSFSSYFGPESPWKNGTDGNRSHGIESTNLPEKLLKMAEIAVTEQVQFGKKNKDFSTLCSTMEYILENNLLETLSLIAQTDTPTGICPHILLFVSRILTDSKATLIPHKSVHPALNKLIIICGKTPASPYESTEIYFLTSVVKLITKNPEYLEFFLANSFPLINSLLSMLLSEDSEVAKLAGSSIVKLIQIGDENAAKIIAEETPFCCKIVDRIIDHYTAIPPSLKPEEIERTHSALLDGNDDDTRQINLSPAVRKFLSFLRWYIFFDMLVNNLREDSILLSYLLNEYRTNFLESSLRTDLAGEGFESEIDAIDSVFFATVIMSNCLRNTESAALFDLTCEFLFVPSEDGENISQKKTRDLATILTERCHVPRIMNRCDDEEEKAKFLKLSSATLQLLEDVLTKPSYRVIHHLIIKIICNRDYLAEEPNYLVLDKPNVVSSKFNSIVVLDQMHQVARQIRSIPNVQTQTSFVEWEHLNQILFLFTSLIPDELKCDTQNERMQYEAYLMEAVKGFDYFIKNCFSRWKIMPDTESLEKSTFLEIIFDNLDAFFQLPYEINLQMFSIWAKISLIPNVFINEYFLDPTINLKAERRSLFNILHRLVEDLQRSVQGIDQLHAKLIATKKSLMGEKGQEQFLPVEPAVIKILHNLIVLEEFCKELSSIVYAKNFILKLCKEIKD